MLTSLMSYTFIIVKFIPVVGQSCIVLFQCFYFLSVKKYFLVESIQISFFTLIHFFCSEKIEYFIMPDDDSISPAIVELKRVPKCAHLVVCRNIRGDFSLWYVVFVYFEETPYYIDMFNFFYLLIC